MSWRPMSSWPATAAPARRAAHAVRARAAVNFELCARANAATTRQLGGLLSNPPSCWRTPSPRWWTRAVASPCPVCVPPIPLAVAQALSWTGGGADDPAIDAHWRARPVGLGKGVRLEQPGRADLRRRRSGQAGQRHPARGLCVVPAALRGRHGLARAGNPCARTPAPGRLRRGRHPPWRAGRRHRLSPDNAGPLGRGSIERSTGKRPALLLNLGGFRSNDIRRPAGPAPRSVPHCTRPRAASRPTSTCCSVAREGLAIMPACSGTWATRDWPATPPRPFDPDAETTPCPSRPAPPQPPGPGRRRLRRDGARRLTPNSADQDRRALHAGRRDRFGGAPAGQQAAGKLGQLVIIENRPGASTVIGAEPARARPDGIADGVGQHHLFRAARAQDRPAHDCWQLRTYRHRLAGAAGAAGAQRPPASTRPAKRRTGPQAERQGERCTAPFGRGPRPPGRRDVRRGPPAPE